MTPVGAVPVLVAGLVAAAVRRCTEGEMKDRWRRWLFGLRRRTLFAFQELAAEWFGIRYPMLGILARAFAGYIFGRAVTTCY